MENHPHSRPPIKLSKRGYNGSNKFAATSIYDDVFGGPPSFGVPNLSPRPEDYYEIFGGFHASRPTSIPVLDLPLGDEEEVDYDVRGCDYGEVFGGAGGLDFASSVDDLLRQSGGGGRDLDCGGVNVDDSSDGAWTPTETESISGESDHFRKRQCSSNGDSYELIGSSTEFSLSYHRVDCGSGDLFSGVTHIAQPNVPEYDCVVDEIRPVRKSGNMKQPVYGCDDDIFDLAGETMQGEGIRETVSRSTESTAGLKTFVSDFGSDRRYGEVGPTDDEMFVSISEISLKTQPSEVPPPSRPPPVLDCKRKDYENCQTTASRVSFGSSSSQSPPYFDVEIDAGSAAAASSLVMKEATEARGKVKAKEVFERKREGGQTSTRPGLKHDAKDKKEHWSKVADLSRSVIDERVRGSSKEEDGAMEPSIRQEKQARNATQVASNSRGSEKAFTTAKISVEEKHGKKSLSSQRSDETDVSDELQEATDFFDLVRTDGSKMAFVAASKDIMKQRDDSQCTDEAVKEDHQVDKVLKHFEAAKEACEKGGSAAGSEVVKGAHRHKEHEKKVKVAQVVGKQEEDEAEFRMVRPIDIGKKPTEEEESQKKEKQLEKDSNKHMENQKRYKEFQETKDDEKRQNKPFELDGNDVNIGQVQEQAETEKTIEVAREQKDDKDTSLTQNSELEESEEKEADELDEGEMIWRMALEQLENEKRLKQALELDERQKKGQACPSEVNVKVSEQVLESENNEKKQVYAKEEVEKKVEQDYREKDTNEKPLQEAFELEDDSIKEALDGEDELKRKHSQEREENEKLNGVNRVQDKFVEKQEEGNDRFVRPPPVQDSAETRRKREVAQSSLCEAKGNSRKTAQPVKPSQSTKRMDKNDGESLVANEKKTTRMRRKIERENKLVRKIDDEREREKENDRIGVDKVALEAHERVERAPMERATAEARDCAAENARERLERSVSGSFSTSSRNSGMGTSSSSSGLQTRQLQTTVSFNCSSYPSDNNGIEGEPALRCKARLERYRRISERAAKALAEKNMLDLLAQKEQAERNRLADTLDAEVKRWSNGKERNLRALLSTLQYILGPDSGWHPVPLTEVITSAAVKKAYRKATLCVHPDKLQQRGANIQQKYISEKVYYLLKEAWNRYNSEEW